MPGGKSPGPSIKNPRVYEALRRKGMSKAKAAAISNAQQHSEIPDRMHDLPQIPVSALAELTTKKRKALPKTAFALPGGRYPIHDEAHARNALARVSQHGTPAEQAKVRAAVRRKFPGIAVGGKKAASEPVVSRRDRLYAGLAEVRQGKVG